MMKITRKKYYWSLLILFTMFFQGFVVIAASIQDVEITATVQGDDTHPPITTVSSTSNGYPYISDTWTRYNVSIILTCSDVSGGGMISGCDRTYYCIDTNNTCIPSLEYNSAIDITTDGEQFIRFRSVDVAANIENIQSFHVQKDAVIPIVSLISVAGDTTQPYTDTHNDNTTAIALEGIDTISGITNCRYSTNNVNYSVMTNNCNMPLSNTISCNIQGLGSGEYTYYYSCSDVAGNMSDPTMLMFNISSFATGGSSSGGSTTPINENTNALPDSNLNTNTNSPLNQNINTNININANNNNNTNENINTNVNAALPVAYNFSIQPFGQTNNRNITLIMAAEKATTMCFYGDLGIPQSASQPHCIPYQISYETILSSGDGMKQINAYFKNEDEMMTEVLTTSIRLDQTPPITPSFSIPSETTLSTINLIIDNVGDAAWVRITGSDIANTEYTFDWVNVRNVYPIRFLETGFGMKSISVETKDLVGNISNIRTKQMQYIEPIVIQNDNTNTVIPIVNTNTNVVVINNNQNNNTGSQLNMNYQINGGTAVSEDVGNVNSTSGGVILLDTDGDGITDDEEIHSYHTDPFQVDTDGDFLNDWQEIKIYKTNPLKTDTDGDSVIDGTEISQGTDPLDPTSFKKFEIQPVETYLHSTASIQIKEEKEGVEQTTLSAPIMVDTPGSRDTDGDGLSDLLEMKIGTDLTKEDTDGDGFSDGEEYLEYGTNPLDPNDNPHKSSFKLKITNWKNQDVMTGKDWIVSGMCSYPSAVSIILSNEQKDEIFIGQTMCQPESKFVVIARKEVSDGYYSLIARAYDENDIQKEEHRIHSIMVDKKQQIMAPKPQAIDTAFIDDIDATIVIHNRRPTVYGKTTYGLEVRATFESLITSSSVITDSASGEFSITSPRALDPGPHRVTLYTVSRDGIRSDSVTIPFIISDVLITIQETDSPIRLLIAIGIVSISLIGTLLLYFFHHKKEKNT